MPERRVSNPPLRIVLVRRHRYLLPSAPRMGTATACAVTGSSNPLIVVISGPSGVGKDTVIALMRRRMPECRFAVTATTRERRDDEVDGEHYFFYSEAGFRRMIADGELMEWAEVYGKLYGVPRRQIAEALESGVDVIVKTDVQGAATIKRIEPRALLVFLAPPDMDALPARLRRRRTESPDDFAVRIRTAAAEMLAAADFDRVVVNHDDRVDETVEEVRAIIAAERARR